MTGVSFDYTYLPYEGTLIPDLSLVLADGSTLTNADIEGHITVFVSAGQLNARYVRDRHELELPEHLAERYCDSNVQFIYVTSNDDRSWVSEVASEASNPVPVAYSADLMMRHLLLDSSRRAVVVDGDRKIRYRGFMDRWNDPGQTYLSSAVDDLLRADDADERTSP